MENIGVISMGIKAPIIREGDDLAKIVVDSVLDATRQYNGKEIQYNINDKDGHVPSHGADTV